MRTTRAVLSLLLVFSVLVGCGDGGAGTETVGTHLTGWSEAEDDRDAVRRLDGRPRLVRETAELAALVELAGPELDTTELEAVDLDDVVLVVGAYPRCDEFSTVEVDDDGATLRFTVTKPNSDNPTQCEWSPLSVVVWAVPRVEVTDDVRLAASHA